MSSWFFHFYDPNPVTYNVMEYHLSSLDNSYGSLINQMLFGPTGIVPDNFYFGKGLKDINSIIFSL